MERRQKEAGELGRYTVSGQWKVQGRRKKRRVSGGQVTGGLGSSQAEGRGRGVLAESMNEEQNLGGRGLE